MRDRKDQQNYDPDPPRCGSCLYFKHKFSAQMRRRGRLLEADAHVCSFGDFETRNTALCDEWRTRDGQTLDLT